MRNQVQSPETMWKAEDSSEYIAFNQAMLRCGAEMGRSLETY